MRRASQHLPFPGRRRHPPRPLGGDVVDDHVCPGLRERPGDSQTGVLAPTRDEGGPAVEREACHRVPSRDRYSVAARVFRTLAQMGSRTDAVNTGVGDAGLSWTSRVGCALKRDAPGNSRQGTRLAGPDRPHRPHRPHAPA